MSRTEIREILMQMVFQMELQSDFSDKAKALFVDNLMEGKDTNQMDYFNNVFEALLNNKNEIDSLIEEFSNGWKINRLSKVDLSVLRICLAESLYVSEDKRTPMPAAINEAVKITKKFGSEDSGKFVNGILGQISRR